MPLASGSSLGPYEILMPIRAGGMGEVYRARDSRLGRDGRVKILDFGLAKNVRAESVGAAATETLTVNTEPGIAIQAEEYWGNRFIDSQIGFTFEKKAIRVKYQIGIQRCFKTHWRMS